MAYHTDSSVRLQGGSDAASARYLYTKLSPFVPLLFHSEDNELLKYEEDEGLQIQPEYYVPIVPIVLINGCQGIGNGWSTFCPPFHPLEVIQNIINTLNSTPLIPMKPWFRGFRLLSYSTTNDRHSNISEEE